MTTGFSGGADQINREVKRIIEEFKITYEQFELLTIVNEQWVDESLSQGSLVPLEPFNVGLLFN